MSVDQSVSGGAADLIGRTEDVERIHAFLDQAATDGAALLLSGEAGVGKSALLDSMARKALASGTQVLRASGAQFEADLSFSSLNQLLGPLSGKLDALGEVQQAALRVALGFGEGPRPDRLIVSNAALALLRVAASTGPLLLVIDDLPWLDQASAAVLGFIARRIYGSGIGVLAASRTDDHEALEHRGLTVHRLAPLTDDASDELVRSRFPTLAEQVRRRLLTTARGNPLALLELPGALSGPQRSALEELPRVLPLTYRLQALFVSRVAGLPQPSRLLLLLSALEGSGDITVLQSSYRILTGHSFLDDLAPAERDQLVRVDDGVHRLVFRHPLIRSGAVEAATLGERRRAHRALAEALDAHPERQAWHLGEAALEPDESVAARLEHAAHLILRRGDPLGAVRALRRAAQLSPAASDRARRLAEAAYVGASAGELRGASELLEDLRLAGPQVGSSLHSATAAARLLMDGDSDIVRAHGLLADAIEAGDHRDDGGDGPLIEALHTLELVCFYAGRPDLWKPYERAIAKLGPSVPPLLSASSKTFADPARTAVSALGELDGLVSSLRDEIDPIRIVRAGTALIYVDRLGDLREFQWRVVRQARDGGPARRPLGVMFHLALEDYLAGRWDEADQLVEEGIALCRSSGYSFDWYFLYIEAVLAAARGDHGKVEGVADRMTGWAEPRGLGITNVFATHARVVDSIGRGDFEAAFQLADGISPAGTIASHTPHALWVMMDLVEAAVRTDRLDEAKAHVAAMREADVAAISPRMALLVGGSAALCADNADSVRIFEQTLAGPGLDRWPFDLARVRLAYGERLRRNRSHTDSRAPLSAALTVFERLGAQPWVARTVKEIRATGRPVTRSGATPEQVLTPQEREIALLAASGLTNKQIAAQLFLSHRTVGAHLYQIFPKLGISSRAALRDALRATE